MEIGLKLNLPMVLPLDETKNKSRDPISICQAVTIRAFKLPVNFLAKKLAAAEIAAEIIKNPSPIKIKEKLNSPLVKFTKSTPKKPNIIPRLFLVSNLSFSYTK